MNSTVAKRQLVLGGAKSGKSSYAEKLVLERAQESDKQAIYIATAQAGDDEMRQRITRHQADRDSNAKQNWQTIEISDDLGGAIDQRRVDELVLVDCLTLWLMNCLTADNWLEQRSSFLESLERCPADVVLVSNEISMGVVPMGEISRRFVDEIGLLHQQLGRTCDTVTLMVAGFPTRLK